MERHHRALTEPDKCQRRRWKIATLRLGVEEALEDRCCLVHTRPALVRIPECQRKPFAAHRRLSAGARRVWRNECGIGQQALPGAPNLDQVVAIGTVAMKKDHQLACASRARLKARSVEFSHSSFSFSAPSRWPFPAAGRSAEPAPRLASSRHDSRPKANALPRRAMAAKLRRSW